MRIAVIGTGNIGGTLARKFAEAGHEVREGSRHPGPGQFDLATALANAEVVVLALPGGAVDGFLATYGGALGSALVIDAANRIGVPGPAHSRAQVLAAAPEAHYARAFNSLGWESLADPEYPEGVASGFFSCAESDRATVSSLISDIGLAPEWVGAQAEDAVDGVLRLWFALVIGQGQPRQLAFRVVRR